MSGATQASARERVAIVIPMHAACTSLEALSLRRCQQILGSYERVLVCPAGMDAGAYRELLPGLRVEEFEPERFRSDRGYNRMLRLPAFYDRFAGSDYLLIYQADCYVFEDRLAEFLDRDFDYIGAPWMNFDWLREAAPSLSRVPGLPHLLQCVGNGGLSLRHVATFRALTRRFAPLGERCDVHEDLYFCQLLSRLSSLRLAPLPTALQFAFEQEPARCFELNGWRLPFGCHAFARCDFEFWRRWFDPDDMRAAGVG